MPGDHDIASAFYDEDWCVTCTCGLRFYGRYRPEVEGAQREHVTEEGLAAARRALEGEQ